MHALLTFFSFIFFSEHIMNTKGLLFIFMLNNFYNNFVAGENILVVMPICFSSHLRLFIPLMDELIRNGHNVTVISQHPMVDNLLQAKYNHVVVKTKYCEIQGYVTLLYHTLLNQQECFTIFLFYL